MRLKEEIEKKWPDMQKQKVLSPRYCSMLATTEKLHKVRIACPSTIFFESGSQRLLPPVRRPKKNISTAEVIVETNANFEAKDKSLYKKVSM